MNEWKIQNHGSTCSECDKPFEDKQSYRTLLYEADGELLRKDLCTGCYKLVEKTLFQSTNEWISSWQGKYKKPPPKPKEAVQKDQTEKVLMEIVSEPEENTALPGTLYILAAMLERKRILKIRDTIQKKEKRIFVYEHNKSGDVFTIDDVKLSNQDWLDVHNQVTGLMTVGLDHLKSESIPSQDISEMKEPEGPMGENPSQEETAEVENIHPE